MWHCYITIKYQLPACETKMFTAGSRPFFSNVVWSSLIEIFLIPKIPQIQIFNIFGKVIIWHIVGYTVIKLVERLTVVLSWRHIMHISFYALAPLVVFAAVGVLIILDRIREDINMRWHGHCRKLFEFGFDQAKIGNEKYVYSRSHRDLL